MARNKRKHRDSRDKHDEQPSGFGLGETLQHLNAEPPSDAKDAADGSSEWEVVETRKKKKSVHENDATRAKSAYPSIYRATSGLLKARVQLKNVQELVLYVLADFPAPQWIAVSNRKAIKKVVVLTVPGIELGMLDGSIALVDSDDADQQTAQVKIGKPVSPDEYYPVKTADLGVPDAVKPLADIFPEVWPIDAGGDSHYTRLYSPLQTFLNVPVPKSKRESGQPGRNWKNKSVSIDDYLATVDELLADDFVLHSSQVESEALQEAESKKRTETGRTQENGWVETNLQNTLGEVLCDIKEEPLAAKKQILAIDCEMCRTAETDYELTRITVVDWYNSVILDELVKPALPITDYVTQYSGITAQMLEPVKTTLANIQERLLEMIGPNTILVGHSLVSDLNALKLAHPHIVDTSMLYPHPRGPPFKSALKYLASKWLQKDIQSGHKGHDSAEDARVAMELTIQKCEKGSAWGCSEAETELIFDRVGRAARPGGADDEKIVSAIVDWGTPAKGHGASADIAIGCTNDDQVMDGIIAAATGKANAHSNADIPGRGADFVWGRMRELEAQRGWWTQGRSNENEQARLDAGADSITGPGSKLGDAVAKAVQRIKRIYEELPPCTALVVYTGNNDPRELYRYHAQHRQFKAEFQTRKWDEVSVKWTDEDERGRKAAARHARSGIGLFKVK